MCPACIGSAVLYLATGGSAGGLAVLAGVFRRKSNNIFTLMSNRGFLKRHCSYDPRATNSRATSSTRGIRP